MGRLTTTWAIIIDDFQARILVEHGDGKGWARLQEMPLPEALPSANQAASCSRLVTLLNRAAKQRQYDGLALIGPAITLQSLHRHLNARARACVQVELVRGEVRRSA